MKTKVKNISTTTVSDIITMLSRYPEDSTVLFTTGNSKFSSDVIAVTKATEYSGFKHMDRAILKDVIVLDLGNK